MTDETALPREDTMLYRAPTPESETVEEIWGKKLETRVVDASEVPAMLKDGWVTNPLHIDNPPKPEEAAGFVPASDTKALKSELAAAKERETALAAEVDGLKSDLRAAEELADTESKAKDAALARLAELEAKPKLGIKKEG